MSRSSHSTENATHVPRGWARGLSVALMTAVLATVFAGLDFAFRALPVPTTLELEFTIPAWPEHGHEPLISTGVTGAADFLYVSYVDAETIAFGYDSWGAGGPISPPLKVHSGQTLRLKIEMPSIARVAGVARPELRLQAGDAFTWTPAVSSHECAANAIEWGANHAGGSSSAPELTGTLRRPTGLAVTGRGTARYFGVVERVRLWFGRAWIAIIAYCIGAFVLAWLGVVRVVRVMSRALRNGRMVVGWATVEKSAGGAHGEERYEACAWLHDLPTKPFLAAFVLSFGACVFAGYAVGRRSMFESFVRFFQPIQPQTYFYPTARELVSYIENTVPKDKILVLVGGASYFRGTGQNPGELWSVELQRVLGERYAVVNFAIDQAGPPAFAGVAYQILARKYPRMVYVTTGGAFSEDPIDGGDVYRYIYWDAYYKGLLAFDPAWISRVRREEDRQMRNRETQELHLGKRIDAATYACDLWTWIGYKHVFTVWSDSFPLTPFRARNRYFETDDPDLVKKQHETRANREIVELIEGRERSSSRLGYVQAADGRWAVDPQAQTAIARHYDQMFPPPVRSHAIIVMLRGNRFFMQTLTEDDRRRVDEMTRLGQQTIQKLGYRVLDVGADFSIDDYVDWGHLMASGGRKVAHTVADDIRRMQW
jgi:hypothetical protein